MTVRRKTIPEPGDSSWPRSSSKPAETPEKHYLKTADEYLESLQDGREVYYKGERVEDVTTHFATAGGIREIADLYDLQFDEEARNVAHLRARGRRPRHRVVPDPAHQGRPALPPRGHQVRRAQDVGHRTAAAST